MGDGHGFSYVSMLYMKDLAVVFPFEELVFNLGCFIWTFV